MRYFIIFLAFLSVIFLIQCGQNPSDASTETSAEIGSTASYVPFPHGFDFPTDRNTIDQWVAKQDVPAIREHAWKLWAGLSQPNADGIEIWRTWYNLNQIFDGLSGAVGGTKHVPCDPRADSLAERYGLAPIYPENWQCGANKEGRFINTIDALLIFSVYYNQGAHDWIMRKDLHQKSTLTDWLEAGKTDIPHAPDTAMVVKPVFYPVKADPDAYTALPVWDGPGDRDPLAYNGFETWERAVAITTNPNPPPTVPVSYLHGLCNRDSFRYEFPTARTVSLDKFYALKLDKETLAKFSSGDSCVVNATFNYVHNRDFSEGDYLVTIGMHILSKEIEDWTMQTVWWHDKPDEGPFAADKPDDIPDGTWKNYLLTQAYYMAVPNRAAGAPHIAYNPYIELMVPEENRMRSNCQNCHRRAGNPLFPAIAVHPIGRKPPKWKPGAGYNPLQEGFIMDSDTIFDGVIRTDFNWAIPMNAN